MTLAGRTVFNKTCDDMFEHLYNKHREELINTCKLILRGDRQLAEDAVHEAYEKLHVHMPELIVTADTQWRSWLMRVAKHKAIDIGRKIYRPPLSPTAECRVDASLEELLKDGYFRTLMIDESNYGKPEVIFESELTVKEVWSTLYRLKPYYRVLLTLRYIKGVPILEIAERTSSKYDATKSALFRAQKKFVETYIKHVDPNMKPRNAILQRSLI